MDGCTTLGGYNIFNAVHSGKHHRLRRHVFIFEVFNGFKVDSSKYHIDHVDGDSGNNRLDNLQMLTRGDHSRKTNLTSRSAGPATSEAIRRFKLDVNGARIDVQEFPSITQAAMLYKNSAGSISRSIRTRRLKAYGYFWEHVEEEDLPGEVWCSLRDKKYKCFGVSSLGRVRTSRGKKTVGGKTRVGYYKTSIGTRHYMVHTLVCLGVHGLPPSDAHTSVDHIDEDKGNNIYTNLVWATPKMQVDRSVSKQITAYNQDGSVFKTWTSISDAARELGGSKQRIWNCLAGKCATSHDLKWAYT